MPKFDWNKKYLEEKYGKDWSVEKVYNAPENQQARQQLQQEQQKEQSYQNWRNAVDAMQPQGMGFDEVRKQQAWRRIDYENNSPAFQGALFNAGMNAMSNALPGMQAAENRLNNRTKPSNAAVETAYKEYQNALNALKAAANSGNQAAYDAAYQAADEKYNAYFKAYSQSQLDITGYNQDVNKANQAYADYEKAYNLANRAYANLERINNPYANVSREQLEQQAAAARQKSEAKRDQLRRIGLDDTEGARIAQREYEYALKQAREAEQALTQYDSWKRSESMKNASRSELERTARGHRQLEQQAKTRLNEASNRIGYDLSEESGREYQKRQDAYDTAMQDRLMSESMLRDYDQTYEQYRMAQTELDTRSDPSFRDKARTGRIKWEQAQNEAKNRQQQADRASAMTGAMTGKDPFALWQEMRMNSRAAGVNTDLETTFSPESLTGDQLDVYFALWAENPQRAAEYARYITTHLDAQALQNLSDWSGKNTGTRAAALFAGANIGLAAGLDPFGEAGQTASKISQTMLSGGGKGLEEKGIFNSGIGAGKIDENVPILGGKSLADLYQLSGSMLQSGETALFAAMTGGAGAFLGTALMGSSAAAADYGEQIENGVDQRTAILHATAAGVAEALFEYVSIDKLVNQDVTAGFLKNFLQQGGVEASEETCTSIANRISDGIISHANGYDSDMDRRYKELLATGMDPETARSRAEWDWIVEVINDGLGGFISGGGMTAGNYMAQGAANAIGSVADAVEQTANNARESRQFFADLSGKQTEYQKPTRTDFKEFRQMAKSADNAKAMQSYARDNSIEWNKNRPGTSTYQVAESLRSQMDGKSLQEMQTVYEQTVEQYGKGIESVAKRALTQASEKLMLDASSNVASLQNTFKDQKAALSESTRGAVQEAYDSAMRQLAVQEYSNQGTITMNQESANDRMQGLDLTASYEKDGSTAQSVVRTISKDGKVTLANGEVVPVSSLQMDSDAKSVLQELSSRFDADAANTILGVYNQALAEGTASEAAGELGAAMSVYENAMRGVSKDAAIRIANGGRSIASGGLSTELAGRLYEMGRTAAKEQSRSQQATLDQLRITTKGASGRRGSVDTSRLDWNKLSSDQKKQVTAVKVIAQALGIDVEFFSSTADESGKFVGENGSYLDGKIRLDINAGRNYTTDVRKGVLQAMSHELTHFLEDYSPELYHGLREFIFDKLTREYGQDWIDQRIQEKIDRSRDGRLSRAAAEKEVIADACEMMLRDSQTVQELLRENRTLGEKIAEWIRNFIAKVRELFDDGAQHAEAQALMGSLEEVQKLWDAALKEAVAAHDQVGSIEKTASEGGEQFSRRHDVLARNDVAWMGDFTSIKDQLEAHREEISGMDPVAEVTYAGEDKDRLVDLIMDQIPGLGGARMIRDGVSFDFDRNGAKYIVLHARSEELRAAALVAPFVAKKGKLIAGQKNHEGTNTTTLTYAAPAIINGSPVNVGLVIQFTSNGRPRAVNVETENGGVFRINKTAQGLRSRTGKSQVTQLLTRAVSNDSISDSTEKSNTFEQKNSDRDYLAAVEKGDMETAQRMVDEAAKAAMPNSRATNKSGNLLILYHGGPGMTVFRGRESSTFSKNAIYMTDEKEIARAYAGVRGKTQKLYANITNPLVLDAQGRNYTDIPIPPDAPQGLLDEFWYDNTADLDNFPVYAEENGYDGVIVYNVREGVGGGPMTEVVAFQSNQVKSADPVTYDDAGNVIPLSERFNTEKPDIRFSERDYSTPSDVDLLMSATETTNGEQKKLLQEAKKKQKEVDRLTKEQQKLKDQVADLQAQMKTTDRALNTKGISGVVRSIMTELGIGDARQKGLAAKAASMLTDTYTEALAKIDANDPDGAWKILSDGAQEIAEYLIDNGTYSEKFGYQWETTAWSKRFAEDRSQAVRDIMGDIISDFSRNRYRNAIQPTKADRLVEKTAKGYEQKLSVQSEQLSAKTEENTRLQEENERLRRRLGFSESNEDSFREQLKRKERQLAEAQAEAKKSGQASTQLQSRIEALENRVQELRKERDSWKGKTERREGQIERERAAAEHKQWLSDVNLSASEFRTRLAETKSARTEAGLRGQIAELEARISDYDKRIKRQQKVLEGKMLTKELQALIKKERDNAANFVKQQKDTAFKNYRERQTETALRNRIRNLADEIKRTMLRPTDGSYVPAALYGSMTKLTDILAVEPREGTKAAEKYRQVQEAIHSLAEEYKNLKDVDDFAYSSEFDEEILKSIEEVEKIFDKGRSMSGDRATVRDLSSEELERVYELVRYIQKTMKDATKLMSNQKYRNVYEAASSLAEQQNAMQSYNKASRTEQARRMRLLKQLSVMRAVEMMSGWNRDSALYQLMHGIEQGVVDADAWVMNYNKALQTLKTGKNEKAYRDALTKQLDYGVKDSEGLDVRMTKLQALQLLMTAEREAHNDKLVHLQKGGAVIRDALAMQDGKKKIREQTIEVTPELLEKIQNSLTEWDKAYMKAIRDYFSKEGREASKVNYKLKHRALETEQFYVPYTVDENYLDTKLDEAGAMTNLWVKTPGSTNQLQQKASQPVIIDGMDTVMAKHVRDMANYIGLAMPVRDFAKVYNARLSQGDGENALPVKQTIHKNYGSEGQHLLTRAVMDIQGATGRGGSWATAISEHLKALQSVFYKSALLINPSVTIKQAASYLAAGSVLSRAALEKGNRPMLTSTDSSHSASLIAQLFALPEGKTAQRLYDEIDRYTSMHYQRRLGMSMAELASEANRSSALKRKMNDIGASLEQTDAGHVVRKAGEVLNPYTWIQRMDVATTAALWVAAKEQARMDLKRTGNPSATDSEYWQHTTELYERALRETQPMYDSLHRNAYQKDTEGLTGYLFPFRTVPIQNHGQLSSSYQNLLAAQKSGDTERIKSAKRFFAKTVVSQFESAVMFSVMSAIAAGLKRKTKKYRDDDDEISAGTVDLGIAQDTAGTMLSVLMPLFGSTLWDTAGNIYDSVRTGKKVWSYDAYSIGVVDLLNEFAKAGENLVTDGLGKLAGNDVSWEQILKDVKSAAWLSLKCLGVPANTIETYTKGLIGNIQDLREGRLPAFNDEAVDRTASVNAGRYLKAYESGDAEKQTAVFNEMLQNFKDAGKSEKEANEAVRNALAATAKDQRESGAWNIDQAIAFLRQTGLYKENALVSKATGYIRDDYNDGKLTGAQASDKLLQYHDDWDENDVYWKLQEWDANKEHEEDEDYKYSEYNDLRDAINAGKDISAAVEKLTAHGKDFQSVNNSVKETIHKRYTRGEISEDEAIDELMKYWQVKGAKEYGAASEDDAWFAVQEWIGKYEHQDDKNYDWNIYEKVYSAIDANKDVTSAYNELVNHGIKKSSLKDAMKTYIVRQFEDGVYSEKKLKNYLAQYCKITKTETVDDIITSAKCYKATGYRLNSIGTNYKDGEASKEMAKKILKTYGGLTDEEADHKIEAWDFQNKYPELEWDADRAENYLYKVGSYQQKAGFDKSAKDMGIPVNVYDQFVSQYSDIEGEDKNGDGVADKNTLKKNRWAFIQSLDLTDEQKEWFFAWNYTDKKGRG